MAARTVLGSQLFLYNYHIFIQFLFENWNFKNYNYSLEYMTSVFWKGNFIYFLAHCPAQKHLAVPQWDYPPQRAVRA